MTEYKKYDTQAVTHYWNVRLAKDAEIVELSENKMVRLTFVDSSRLDSDDEMWVEANPTKMNSVSSSYLEKGDVVGLSGKLTYRTYGDEGNKKGAHNLRNAQVVLAPDLLATLKERGWEPGSENFKGEGKKVAAAVKKVDKPVEGKRKPGRPAKAKSIPIDIDLDDDEAADE